MCRRGEEEESGPAACSPGAVTALRKDDVDESDVEVTMLMNLMLK